MLDWMPGQWKKESMQNQDVPYCGKLLCFQQLCCVVSNPLLGAPPHTCTCAGHAAHSCHMSGYDTWVWDHHIAHTKHVERPKQCILVTCTQMAAKSSNEVRIRWNLSCWKALFVLLSKSRRLFLSEKHKNCGILTTSRPWKLHFKANKMLVKCTPM